MFDILSFGTDCDAKIASALAGKGYGIYNASLNDSSEQFALQALNDAADRINLDEVRVVLCSVDVPHVEEFALLDRVREQVRRVPFLFYCGDEKSQAARITPAIRKQGTLRGAREFLVELDDHAFAQVLTHYLESAEKEGEEQVS